VLTAANEAEVLPRFFGRSAREAAELAAELLPQANPPLLQQPRPRPIHFTRMKCRRPAWSVRGSRRWSR
jgi:hypothetical protein